MTGCRSVPELAAAPVHLNVYWLRSVAFDENGRAVGAGGAGGLSWGRKLLKNILGVYHVGVEVHGTEYTFGSYHAPGMRQLGGPDSGVCAHYPRRAGPQCVFREAVPLGFTALPESEVEAWAGHLGRGDFSRGSYSRLERNCVDFSRRLLARLGADGPPAWCERALSTARLLGVAGGGDDASERYLGEASGGDQAQQMRKATTATTTSHGPGGFARPQAIPLLPVPAAGAAGGDGGYAAVGSSPLTRSLALEPEEAIALRLALAPECADDAPSPLSEGGSPGSSPSPTAGEGTPLRWALGRMASSLVLR
eukprot:TRINITY_DN73154_c0_g1_i1.p1 TRINITY_DN73154_c0_g1~~TRINITY_DN73154_c0_g1_i1.p1  ORF type:complete len:309 (+),score=61.00 TRINITY_DN73154_c0_g1_i1:117-1043(+)